MIANFDIKSKKTNVTSDILSSYSYRSKWGLPKSECFVIKEAMYNACKGDKFQEEIQERWY